MQKAELGSTLRNMLPQLATSRFVAWQVGSEGGNTGNNAFQLAMQQCCATSLAKMLRVFLESASEQARWSKSRILTGYPTRPLRISRVSPAFRHTIHPLFTKLVRSRWMNVGHAFFQPRPQGAFPGDEVGFFVCFDWPRQKELRNIQPSWHHVWPITHIH